MRSVLLAAACAAALTACATPPAPRVEEVKVPYAVPCLSWVPARPTLLAPHAKDEYDRARWLIVDWQRMRLHIDLLEELLRPCLVAP